MRHALSSSRRKAPAVPLEAVEQKTVVQWFWHEFRAFRGSLQASGNGLYLGGTTPRQKAAHWANFLAMGGCPGQSDLFLGVAAGGYHGLLIEMKRQRATRSDVTDDEFAYIGLMLRRGYQATWCAGAHEATAVISEYMSKFTGE